MSDRRSWNVLLSHPVVRYLKKVESRPDRILPWVEWAMLRKGDRLRVQGVRTPPPDDTERASLSGATPSGFLKKTRGALPYLDSIREKHTTLVNIILRTIAYPIQICCPDHWLMWASLATAHVPPPSCPDIFYSLHFRFAYGKGLQSFSSSCFWAFHCFAMDSKELSLITDCFGDQKAIKTPKLNTIWLELITRVLNMLIGLKSDNYYSKVFKRVNYKLSNNTFWVVIRCFPREWVARLFVS